MVKVLLADYSHTRAGWLGENLERTGHDLLRFQTAAQILGAMEAGAVDQLEAGDVAVLTDTLATLDLTLEQLMARLKARNSMLTVAGWAVTGSRLIAPSADIIIPSEITDISITAALLVGDINHVARFS